MRSRPTRVSVRRPSSTAATICAARAAPIPGNATKLVVPGAREPVESRRQRSSTALARSSALAFARPWPKHDSQQLVVAERRGAHALQLLARAIVRRDALHRTPSLLYFRPDAPRCCPVCVFSSSCAGCSEPPQKEIDRAQGAVDAARAAGAEQYARCGIRGSDDGAPASRTTPSLSATIASR